MTLKDLKKWEKNNNKIAIYCAGKIGIAYYEIFKKVGIKINCFFDSNTEKVGREVIDGCFCKNADLVKDKDNYIIFIGILDRYYDEVLYTVRKKGFLNIAYFTTIFDDIITNKTSLYVDLITWFQDYPLLEVFYVRKPSKNVEAVTHKVLEGKKIAVYTSVFGKYDKLYQPLSNPDNIDYYFISDNESSGDSSYIWIDAKKVIPNEINSPIKRNRYVKMHPHLIFPDYDYSIYVDGNIKIKKDISSFIQESATGISVFMHPRRDCIFYEAITISNFRRVLAVDVGKQMKRYIIEGMPLHYGLPEMPVIAREHNKTICKKIMDEWWKEFDQGAQRDQLSFMYVMWKNGMGIQDISSLGSDFRQCEFLEVKNHQLLSKKVKNEN